MKWINFVQTCGFNFKKDLHAFSVSKPSSPPIKSYSKVSSLKDTLTSTASKLGEKITHSKSPIGIPLKFNLQNPFINMKQKVIQNN